MVTATQQQSFSDNVDLECRKVPVDCVPLSPVTGNPRAKLELVAKILSFFIKIMVLFICSHNGKGRPCVSIRNLNKYHSVKYQWVAKPTPECDWVKRLTRSLMLNYNIIPRQLEGGLNPRWTAPATDIRISSWKPRRRAFCSMLMYSSYSHKKPLRPGAVQQQYYR